jgi:transcriptional regulator with XRE-family HTH domain
MNYHNKLQNFFKAKGISQKQIAEELNVSRSIISRYLSKNAPNYEFIKAITEFHPEIDWNYMFKDTEDSSEEENISYQKNPEMLLGEIKSRIKQLEEWHKIDTQKK